MAHDHAWPPEPPKTGETVAVLCAGRPMVLRAAEEDFWMIAAVDELAEVRRTGSGFEVKVAVDDVVSLTASSWSEVPSLL